MSQEILSVAVFQPVHGKEEEAIAVMRALIHLAVERNYSRDTLYRDQNSHRYLHIRCWISEETRSEADGDPQVHSYWAKLRRLIRVEKFYDGFTGVDATDAR
jgi:hypothetical protein